MNDKLNLKYNINKEGGITMEYRDFSYMLKSLRKSKGITQSQLGANIGLSKAVISKYENGLGYPTFDVLIKMADFFGVTTDYILGVSKVKTIDVSKLTDSQIDTVHKVIAEFNKANKK